MTSNLLQRYNAYPGPEILQAVFHASARTENHKLLIAMRDGKISLAGWKDWGVLRYEAALGFIPLLKKGIEKTEEARLPETHEALRKNLRDELGYNRHTGAGPYPGASHEEWRQKFYGALSLKQKDMKPFYSPPETERYRRVLEMITQNGDVWQHVGALLSLEYAIGKEMDMLNQGLDANKELNHIFTLANKNSWQRDQAIEARKYIAHHASHDIELHFPELQDAILTDLRTHFSDAHEAMTTAVARIEHGAGIIGQIRSDFYDGLLTVKGLRL